MKKKLGLLVFAGALSAFLVVGSTLAWFTDKETATNTLTMGKVEIELFEEAESEEKRVVSGEDGLTFDNVVPGDVLVKKVDVKNVGTVDAYIRVKVTSELENLLDIQPNWTKIGDYYYYNNSVEKNDFTPHLFTKVTIPGTWNNEMAEKSFNIFIEAQAIQVDNFYPTGTDTFSVTGLAHAWENQ